jgi:hypothetical protein
VGMCRTAFGIIFLKAFQGQNHYYTASGGGGGFRKDFFNKGKEKCF